MGEENVDKRIYFDRETSGEPQEERAGRGGRRTVEEDGRVLMKTRTYTQRCWKTHIQTTQSNKTNQSVSIK